MAGRSEADSRGVRPPRTRDAAATRRALLEAARELFAAVGYDATTVRAVADRAGVNQALLFRHFGNKEGLFAEAISGAAMAVLEDGPPEELLRRTLDAIMADDPSGTELFFAVLRSTGSSEAGVLMRAELESRWAGAFASLAATDDVDDAALRAELVLAWLLGIGLLRTVIATRPIAGADPGTISAHVLRGAQAILDGRSDTRTTTRVAGSDGPA
ncbi:TetR family transcriptional regulator [Pseudonocardia sulfidoxydans NBRC 16205]|uniref:TetR family transcriptional regulator n=1 Tax=Pseudonocardia sulfidoxydans NBRC 16205 TaxID=1223511 RepID=A0A511DN16_9PSEU|nr:TetR/AcrR family transcriptional regulator [Pseudonocardia sulfidoxydans]GEL26215.1 TetR family transcriptional regulator [Pseudonocardia sulfidoxydans NBRC 16205]